MSININLQYKSNKKLFKITPNTSIQFSFIEACTHFHINSAEYLLIHKKNIIDINVPFRLLNLINNICFNIELKSEIYNNKNIINSHKVVVPKSGNTNSNSSNSNTNTSSKSAGKPEHIPTTNTNLQPTNTTDVSNPTTHINTMSNPNPDNSEHTEQELELDIIRSYTSEFVQITIMIPY